MLAAESLMGLSRTWAPCSGVECQGWVQSGFPSHRCYFCPPQPLQDTLALLSQGSWGKTQAHCQNGSVREPHGLDGESVAWDETLQTPRACLLQKSRLVSLRGEDDQEQERRREMWE